MEGKKLRNKKWEIRAGISYQAVYTPFFWSKSSTNKPPLPLPPAFPSGALVSVTKVNILGNNFLGSFYNIINQGAAGLMWLESHYNLRESVDLS